ncbi:MAG: MATE family efflux transporter [Spirochaetales bacterium]|nr:MATE family efflux transporter [Spirochaetales bacterium]
MRSLTEGNETKVIINFALPMLIGNVFQQLYTTVDGIVVGRGVGKEALGAIGASFPIIFFMISLSMGLMMGASIMLSQFFGAKDYVRMKRTMSTGYVFLIAASVAVTIVGLALSGPVLKAIKVPDAVYPHAKSYLQIMFIGMFFMFGYNTISAILRGLGDSKNPLYFLIVASIVNVGLDLLFVLVFKWGIAGAAWATVISQGLSFVIGIVYMQRSKEESLHIDLKHAVFDRELFRTMIRIGLPTGIQQSLVSLGFIALTRIVNPFGTNVIAGYTAAMRLDSFAAMPAMNLSMAISTFVGQNLGAGKPERVRKGYLSTLAVSLGISLLMTVVMVLFKYQLVGLFTSDSEVLRYGAEYLVIVSSFYVVFTSMFITGGVLRGAGDTFIQMIFTITALWGVRIPAAALLSSFFGTAGIWWGIPAGWIVGFTGIFLYYLSGRWKRKVIVKHPTAILPG